MQLLNATTGKTEDLPSDLALDALAKGTHTPVGGKALLNPEGKLVVSPDADVETNVSQYGYQIPSLEHLTEIANQAKYGEGTANALKAGTEGLLRGATLSGSDWALPAIGLTDKEAMLQREKRNPAAAGVGEGVGIAASMLLGEEAAPAELLAKAGRGVEAAVAPGALEAGASLGARTLHGGQTVASKILGEATTGAGFGAATVSSEAALGDPDLTAERVAAEIGMGALIGGGLGATIGGGQIVKDAAASSGIVMPKVGRMAARVLTGANEDDVSYYIANRDAVNAAPSREHIKNEIDDIVSKRFEDAAIAKADLQEARRVHSEAYHAKRYDLGRASAPQDLADDVMAGMEQQKVVLGDMSDRLDEVLNKSGAEFQKKDLLKFIDNIGKEISTTSDEGNGAVGKLFAQRERIAQNYGDKISGVELRGIMRDVRKDINWNRMAGEFNDTLNNARLEFTHKISDVIKKGVPGYEGLVDEMSARARNLNDMSKNFGTREKAINALNATASVKGKLKSDMLEEFSKLTKTDYLAQLEDLRKSKDLLELSRRGDIKDTLLPAHAKRVAEAEARLDEAEAALDPVRRLTQGRTQNVVRSGRFKNASMEDKKAIEALGKQTGRDFYADISNRNVYDSFYKDTTNGTRKTFLGYLIGQAVGGPLGSLIGGVAGAAADKYGTQAVKKIIDIIAETPNIMPQSMPHVLDALVDRYGATTLAAMDTAALGAAVQLLIQHKDETKEQVHGRQLMKLQQAAEKSTRTINSATKALFQPLGKPFTVPKMEKGPDLLKTFKRRIGEVQKLSTQPETLLTTLHDSTIHSFDVAPNVSTSLQNTIIKGNQFLASKIPQPPVGKLPFDAPFEPSQAQMNSFDRYYETVHDPLVVLDQLKGNRIHSESLEALASVYPKLYDQMKTGIISELASKQKALRDMPFQRRVVLSTFLGQPLDSSLVPSNIAANQQILAAQQQAKENKEAAQSGHTTQAGLKNLTVADRAKTDFQANDA